MTRCETCSEWMVKTDTHVCPPKWQVREIDQHGDDDFSMVFASDAQSAAEEWAERSDADSCEYSCISGAELEVDVRRDETEPWVEFLVTGESVPQYYARKRK